MEVTTSTCESLLRAARSGDVRKLGIEGDCGAGPLYGGFVPATRSGLTGKMGMPGDMANFVGDWGSIGIGLSFNRARLTVLKCFFGEWYRRCMDFVRGCGVGKVVAHTSSDVNKANLADSLLEQRRTGRTSQERCQPPTSLRDPSPQGISLGCDFSLMSKS